MRLNGETANAGAVSIRHITPVIVGGLPVLPVSRQSLAEQFISDWEANRDRQAFPVFSTSANGHIIALAARDAEFKNLLLEADHIDADGMPLVIASRIVTKNPLPERIATTDFIHDIAALAYGRRIRFFLLGSTEEENRRARDVLLSRYPFLDIDGHHGFYNRDQEQDIIEKIKSFETDLLWVGLGVPREHYFVRRNRKALRGVTWIKTCGGLFNFLSGQRRRAPVWMQNYGLEWAWRCLQEPSRLGPRYWATNGQALRLLWRYRSR